MNDTENEFRYKGKTYVAKEAENGATCVRCAFKRDFEKCRELRDKMLIPECNAWRRADGREVYFVEKVATKKANGKAKR